jgi:hypothetical protein
VTFEEGTSPARLYDLLKPHVAKVVVCDPQEEYCVITPQRAVFMHAARLWPSAAAEGAKGAAASETIHRVMRMSFFSAIVTR